MNHIQQAIARAIERISVPGQWTQGAWARDKGGAPVDGYGTDAVCWCAAGALRRECATRLDYELALEMINRLPNESLGVSYTNDIYATNERVIAMMRAALP